MRKNACYLLCPVGFALAPMLTFFSRNLTEVQASEAVTAMLLVLSSALIVQALLIRVLRSPIRGGLFGAVAFALFFYYGMLTDSMPLFRFTVAGLPIGPNKVLYLLIGASIVSGAAFALKGSEDAVASMWRFVRLTAAALVASGLAMLVYAAATMPHTSDSVSLPPLEGSRAVASAQRPDIYYFVLDAYLGADTLRSATGYDNSAFVEALEKRGFFVADDSYSNYYNTDASMLSVLNMEYLSDVQVELEAQGHDWDAEYLSRNNRVMRRLRDAGYGIVIVRSPYGPLSRVDGADVVRDPSSLYVNELTTKLLDSTMLRPLQATLLNRVSGSGRLSKRGTVLRGFEYASETTAEKSPKCVFMHVLVPHVPFVFDENGAVPSSDVLNAPLGTAEERTGYAAQLEYTNRLTTKLLDHLFEDIGDRPSIIVIQGDHGARFGLTEQAPAEELPWTDPASTSQDYREFYSILNAFYFSGGKPDALRDSVSSVNTFRLILNEAIGTEYPLLEDRSFGYRIREAHLTDLVDVTQKLDEPQGQAPAAANP